MQRNPLGDHLRQWRRRRHMSQLDLALEADVSQKHLSFVESGRASASRDMVLRLAERLDVPRREQNAMLVAAGFAPVFLERSLDDPEMSAVRTAIGHVLDAYVPFPALAVDRHWTMLAVNSAVSALLESADPKLLKPPVNVLRLALHPKGLAPSILNYAEWFTHVVDRLKRQATMTGDATLIEMIREFADYGDDARLARSAGPAESGDIFVPLRLRTKSGTLDLISTTTLFGTPRDITMAEVAIEAFLPATPVTATLLQEMEDARTRPS